MTSPSPIPPGHHTLTPHLTIKNAAEAIDFYAKAFGAEEVMRQSGPGGSIMHARLRIGDSMVMLNDEFPEHGSLGPGEHTAVTLHLYVEDVDTVYQRAVDAGCKVLFPLSDAFWGDRYGMLQDPYGHRWSVASRIEEVSPEECDRRAAAAFGG